MGWLGSKDEDTTTEVRIRVKAERLGELRKQVDQALSNWEKRIAEAIPSDLGITVKLELQDDKGTITWAHGAGVHLDGEVPKTFEDKRDVVKLLPDLEEALESRLSKLVAELEAQGRLSVVEDAGRLSEADIQGGELSEGRKVA